MYSDDSNIKASADATFILQVNKYTNIVFIDLLKFQGSVKDQKSTLGKRNVLASIDPLCSLRNSYSVSK